MAGDYSGALSDDVYQPDGSEVTDDGGVLDAEDTLLDRGPDPYDEGWSPPERPLGVEHRGTTASEQHQGESLDERLAEEIPDDDAAAWDGIGDLRGGDGEALDGQVGDARAGRLVALDADGDYDSGRYATAVDVGIEGGAASAEEAAIHLVPDDDTYGLDAN